MFKEFLLVNLGHLLSDEFVLDGALSVGEGLGVEVN